MKNKLAAVVGWNICGSDLTGCHEDSTASNYYLHLPGWTNRTQFEETWASLLGVLVSQSSAVDSGNGLQVFFHVCFFQLNFLVPEKLATFANKPSSCSAYYSETYLLVFPQRKSHTEQIFDSVSVNISKLSSQSSKCSTNFVDYIVSRNLYQNANKVHI